MQYLRRDAIYNGIPIGEHCKRILSSTSTEMKVMVIKKGIVKETLLGTLRILFILTQDSK